MPKKKKQNSQQSSKMSRQEAKEEMAKIFENGSASKITKAIRRYKDVYIYPKKKKTDTFETAQEIFNK